MTDMQPTRPAPKKMTGAVPSHEANNLPNNAPNHDETHEAPRTRTRTRMTSDGPPTTDNYINFENIPDDISLEFKRFSVVGQEFPYYIQSMRKQGWEPVNPQEHPDWVNLPPGYDAQTVIVDGLILMERPMWMTKEAQEDNEIVAKRRIVEAEQRLGKTPEGEMTRDHAGAKPKITKEVGRMVPMAIED